MPPNLSPFCVSLGNMGCGCFVAPTNLPRLTLKNIFPAKAQRRKALPRFKGFSSRLCVFAGETALGMVVANSGNELRCSRERKKVEHENSRFILAGGRHVVWRSDSRFAVGYGECERQAR